MCVTKILRLLRNGGASGSQLPAGGTSGLLTSSFVPGWMIPLSSPMTLWLSSPLRSLLASSPSDDDDDQAPFPLVSPLR